jgi:ethanolamine utilization protein EutN
MRLGRVIGNVNCTQKVESWEGIKLLLVQPLDENLKKIGEPVVACDTVQAGLGDTVLTLYQPGSMSIIEGTRF